MSASLSSGLGKTTGTSPRSRESLPGGCRCGGGKVGLCWRPSLAVPAASCGFPGMASRCAEAGETRLLEKIPREETGLRRDACQGQSLGRRPVRADGPVSCGDEEEDGSLLTQRPPHAGARVRREGEGTPHGHGAETSVASTSEQCQVPANGSVPSTRAGWPQTLPPIS